MDIRNILESRHQEVSYTLKEGTSTSFTFSAGVKAIFPSRLSITPYSGQSGRNLARLQLQGRYKIGEPGIFYSMNERKIHSKIIEINSFPDLVGWGEIDRRFGFYDLFVIESKSNCKDEFIIHFFKGLAQSIRPEFLFQIFHFLTEAKKIEALKRTSLLGK